MQGDIRGNWDNIKKGGIENDGENKNVDKGGVENW